MTDIETEILTVVRRKLAKLEKVRDKKLDKEEERHAARKNAIRDEHNDAVHKVREATPESVWKALTDAD